MAQWKFRAKNDPTAVHEVGGEYLLRMLQGQILGVEHEFLPPGESEWLDGIQALLQLINQPTESPGPASSPEAAMPSAPPAGTSPATPPKTVSRPTSPPASPVVPPVPPPVVVPPFQVAAAPPPPSAVDPGAEPQVPAFQEQPLLKGKPVRAKLAGGRESTLPQRTPPPASPQGTVTGRQAEPDLRAGAGAERTEPAVSEPTETPEMPSGRPASPQPQPRPRPRSGLDSLGKSPTGASPAPQVPMGRPPAEPQPASPIPPVAEGSPSATAASPADTESHHPDSEVFQDLGRDAKRPLAGRPTSPVASQHVRQGSRQDHETGRVRWKTSRTDKRSPPAVEPQAPPVEAAVLLDKLIPAGVSASRPQQRRGFPPADEELEMTPMIDMTFLLLVFFMVASTVSAVGRLELPKSVSGDTEDPENRVVMVLDFATPLEEDERTYLNGSKPASLDTARIYLSGSDETISAADIETVLEREFKEKPAAQFVLQAHRKMPAGVVREVLNIAQRAGARESMVGVSMRR